MLFAASPGPNFIFVLTRSLSNGRASGQLAVIGIWVGALIHTLLAVLGLSAILATSAGLYQGVKLAGAAYLVYLGVRKIWAVSLTNTAQAAPETNSSFRDGLITMLLNPKSILYFFAFLPTFVDIELGQTSLQLAVFGIIQSLAALLVYTVIVQIAGVAQTWVRSYQAQVNVASGVAYVLLGVWIALR